MGRNLIFIFALTLSFLFLGVVSATSTNYVADCNLVQGDGEGEYDQVIDINQWLVSNTETFWYNRSYKNNSEVISLNENLTAGNYSVTLVSYDSYPGRNNTNASQQSFEQYYISFFKDEISVKNTSSTYDLEDNVEFAQNITSMNISLTNGADSIQAFHAKYEERPTSNGQNSLNALCVGIKKIEEEICEFNINIRYNFANTFNTGIGISENGTWLDDLVTLTKGNNHEIKYRIDNNGFLPNNATITVKLNNNTISKYNYPVGNSHSKTLNLETENLECNTYNKISLKVESEENEICFQDDVSDNYAEREFFFFCEEEPSCGNGNLEFGEQCDFGLLNGFLCWAGYGSQCNYCTSSCKLKTITNYCGDGVKQSCEQCDGEENCTSECKWEEEIPEDEEPEEPEEPICENLAGVRYSYGNSFGTGIAIRPEGGNWTQESNNIDEGIYEIRFAIDNKSVNPVGEVNLTVKIDESIITKYSKNVNKEHINSTYLNTTGLCGVHTIYLEVENEDECDLSDNYAQRQIYIQCDDEDEEESEDDEPQNNIIKLSSGVIPYNECLPNWECSGWSECSNGVMTRDCVDTNLCALPINEPYTVTDCIDPVLKESKVANEKKSNISSFLLGIFVFLILIVLLLSLLLKRE
jgi:hypothetical protein